MGCPKVIYSMAVQWSAYELQSIFCMVGPYVDGHGMLYRVYRLAPTMHSPCIKEPRPAGLPGILTGAHMGPMSSGSANNMASNFWVAVVDFENELPESRNLIIYHISILWHF